MISVTVYSTGPTCVRCTMTCRVLASAGIPFEVIDLRETPAAREYVSEELGYSEAPVVVLDQEPQFHWSGFRPDLVAQLAKRAILPSDATREARSPAR